MAFSFFINQSKLNRAFGLTCSALGAVGQVAIGVNQLNFSETQFAYPCFNLFAIPNDDPD